MAQPAHCCIACYRYMDMHCTPLCSCKQGSKFVQMQYETCVLLLQAIAPCSMLTWLQLAEGARSVGEFSPEVLSIDWHGSEFCICTAMQQVTHCRWTFQRTCT